MSSKTTKTLPRIFCGAFLWCCLLPAHAQSSDNASYLRTTFSSANGEVVFRSICQGCHMPDAKGAKGAGTYPALTDNPRLASPNYMAAVILNGRRDMPSFAPKPGPKDRFFDDATLTDEQIAGVINYIRTHFGNRYDDRISAQEVSAMHP
ncbi:cytochrome c [Dyella sp. GSA-30]|uniref:c-type cytochrome n=1 Tax=Dyella sp. GSA-30 TaxID=2994496 RepID=UPI0024913D5C|nr:cytochrome c [Dyella sp. GSA-30]BDU21842.1 cytochrome c6 [Dyella sp. GSA-30]